LTANSSCLTTLGIAGCEMMAFFMRRTILQPQRSGIIAARQICDTAATTSNPPPTVQASNNPTSSAARVGITKIL
ncbi:hypothetical protein EJ02DRAFT_349174, partial [Clathrospora elynae]